jgi:hypothetical protein
VQVSAIVRPTRRGRPRRHVARVSRIWADPEGLHIVTPVSHRQWPLGAGGLSSVRFVHTAAYDLDHGVDPLLLNPFGHLELPGPGGASPVTVDLRDWISDTDMIVEMEVANPLAVSGLSAVLREAGVDIDVVRESRRTDEGPRAGWTNLLGKRDRWSLIAILVGIVLGMVGYAGGPAAVPCAAIAVVISAVVLVGRVLPEVRLFSAERRTRWAPTQELRPCPQAGLRRGFLRHARMCVVGDQLVVVDGAGGELWLGREAVTGVEAAVRVEDGNGPVRVELRRADGTSLARLPWADWFAPDGGAALDAFCRAADLPLKVDAWRSSRADGITGLSRPVYCFTSDGVAAAQELEAGDRGVGLGPATMPTYVAGLPSLATLPVGREGGAGAVVALAALLVLCCAAAPSLAGLVRRGWQRRVAR